MMRAAIYVRVSTEEQGDRNLSLPAQLDVCRRLAEDRGWEVVEEYEDVGSAKSDQRESFQRLVTDAGARRFDALVVYKYSRFARNDLDSQLYEAELDRRGVTLVSATEPVEGDTSSGWLTKRLMQVMGEFENRHKAEFVKAGMRQLVEQGGWPWRAPLGYVNQREQLDAKRARKWVELDPAVAPLVRQAFELYATGEHGLQALADVLAERGLRTRDGNRLTPQIMLDLLKNEFYAGTVSSQAFDVRARGQHEPLVSQELFDRVQAVVVTRNRSAGATRTSAACRTC